MSFIIIRHFGIKQWPKLYENDGKSWVFNFSIGLHTCLVPGQLLGMLNMMLEIRSRLVLVPLL